MTSINNQQKVFLIKLDHSVDVMEIKFKYFDPWSVSIKLLELSSISLVAFSDFVYRCKPIIPLFTEGLFRFLKEQFALHWNSAK